MQTMQTIPAFIAQHGLTMTAAETDSNPNMAADDWSRTATHYICTIRRGDASMEVPFSQGSAHTQPPTLETVLDAISMDIASVENAPDWLDFAEEWGYMEGGAKTIRQAREAHETISRQRDELREMIGDDALETLLWSVERL